MSIGDIAKAGGISAKMKRYCEETGVIRPTTQPRSSYKLYPDNVLQPLRTIRRTRHLGFTDRQVDNLPTLGRDRTRTSVKEIAIGHVPALEKKLRVVKDMSDALLHHCHGDDRPDCPIQKTLGSTDALAPLPKTPGRPKTRAFDYVC